MIRTTNWNQLAYARTMAKSTIADRLRKLAADDQNKSKTARVREVIDEIEAALAAGVSRQKVLDALAADGLVMSMRTFDTILKRIRQSRGGKPARASTSRVKEKPSGVAAEPDSEPSAAGSHNPRDIDDILRSTPDLDALAKLARRSKK